MLKFFVSHHALYKFFFSSLDPSKLSNSQFFLHGHQMLTLCTCILHQANLGIPNFSPYLDKSKRSRGEAFHPNFGRRPKLTYLPKPHLEDNFLSFCQMSFYVKSTTNGLSYLTWLFSALCTLITTIKSCLKIAYEDMKINVRILLSYNPKYIIIVCEQGHDFPHWPPLPINPSWHTSKHVHVATSSPSHFKAKVAPSPKRKARFWFGHVQSNLIHPMPLQWLFPSINTPC